MAEDSFNIPPDSASWNFQLAERYYSKALSRLLDDSLIHYQDGEEIDRQHIQLWYQDSCKFKQYVFVMADAINQHKKPPTPKEFYASLGESK